MINERDASWCCPPRRRASSCSRPADGVSPFDPDATADVGSGTRPRSVRRSGRRANPLHRASGGAPRATGCRISSALPGRPEPGRAPVIGTSAGEGEDDVGHLGGSVDQQVRLRRRSVDGTLGAVDHDGQHRRLAAASSPRGVERRRRRRRRRGRPGVKPGEAVQDRALVLVDRRVQPTSSWPTTDRPVAPRSFRPVAHRRLHVGTAA